MQRSILEESLAGSVGLASSDAVGETGASGGARVVNVAVGLAECISLATQAWRF